MDFGRLPNVDRVDFSLAPDPMRNRELLGPSESRLRVRVGCPIWGNAGWKGSFVPPGAKTSELLAHYSRQLETVEVNPMFYGIPPESTLRRWVEMTPPGFRFCPKFPRVISHDSVLTSAEQESRSFLDALQALAPRLGPSFLQLPPQFGPERGPELAAYLRRFTRSLVARGLSQADLAVEFRNPGWFRGRALIREAREILEPLEIAAVITDVAGRRDVSHSDLTAKRALVRFVGDARDSRPRPSDLERVDAWVEKIRAWTKLGLEEVYFFVHQPEDLAAPETIRVFIDRLNAATGLEIRNWEPFLEEQPGLFEA